MKNEQFRKKYKAQLCMEKNGMVRFSYHVGASIPLLFHMDNWRDLSISNVEDSKQSVIRLLDSLIADLKRVKI